MSITDLVKSRRTVNEFKPQVPPQKAVLAAIDASRWVPNHHLTQPWHFYFPNHDMISRIIDLNAALVARDKNNDAAESKRKRWMRIPGWLVITCDISSDPVQANEDYAACSCAIYVLSLLLWQQGIASKWTSGKVIREDQFYDICWLDKHTQQVVALIWYGYAAEIPLAAPRRNLDKIVTIY